MKKTIFLASIFSIIFLSLVFAQPAEAVWMKVTGTVTSITIPTKAAALQLPINTQFKIKSEWPNESYFQVLENDFVIKHQTLYYNIQAGTTTSFTFLRDPSKTLTARIALGGMQSSVGDVISDENCQWHTSTSGNIYYYVFVARTTSDWYGWWTTADSCQYLGGSGSSGCWTTPEASYWGIRGCYDYLMGQYDMMRRTQGVILGTDPYIYFDFGSI